MKSVRPRHRSHPGLNAAARPSRGTGSSASAPDSVRLSLRPHAFLNQLLHLSQARLIIRSHGLTLFLETEFGVFFSEANTARPWLADPVSGLAIDPAEVSDIVLLHQADAPSSFEICTHSSGFALAIQPTAPEDESTIVRIVDSFAEARIESGDLLNAGAGAWLDEELTTSIEPNDSEYGVPPLSFDRTSGRIEVCASGPGYGICDSFVPGFVDRDGSTFRLADDTHRRVVFASIDRFGNLPRLA